MNITARIREIAATAFEDALTWAFPAVCRACGDPLGNSPTLCPACWETIPRWNGSRCETCGLPTPKPVSRCEGCLPSVGETCPIHRVRAATAYAGIVREAIHALKYESRPGLARRLAGLILEIEPPLLEWKEYAALIPIPLHRVREAERGFNQAERIARVVGKAVGVPVASRWLRRTRPTRALANLGGLSARQAEMEDVFAAKLPASAQGKALLLVDDILTTGTTTAEAASVLLAAGAGAVDVLAVARAGLEFPSDGVTI